MAAMMSLRAMSKEMAAKFKGQLSLQELDELMASFIKYVALQYCLFSSKINSRPLFMHDRFCYLKTRGGGRS